MPEVGRFGLHFKRIHYLVALMLVLVLVAGAMAQRTISYGVFTNHGESTTWGLPWDRTHNTDEGHKTGITASVDVFLFYGVDLAAFVATDGAIGLGPRLRLGTYWQITPFVDAMIVNLHYNPFAARTWNPETGFGADLALTRRLDLRYQWARSYGDGDRDRSFSTVSVAYRF